MIFLAVLPVPANALSLLCTEVRDRITAGKKAGEPGFVGRFVCETHKTYAMFASDGSAVEVGTETRTFLYEEKRVASRDERNRPVIEKVGAWVEVTL